jgi:hypothetical protein
MSEQQHPQNGEREEMGKGVDDAHGGVGMTPERELVDEDPSEGQEGQPGLPAEGDWSPSSEYSES